MNETLLNDLLQKIHNTVHDFELEHGVEGLVDVSMGSNRIVVEVPEQKTFDPPFGSTGTVIHAGDLSDASRFTVQVTHAANSIYPADPLTGEVEAAHTNTTDYTAPTPSPEIRSEGDGRVFNSQAEHENWLAQQKRNRGSRG